MTVDAVTLKRLIEAELAKLSDARAEQYIRGLLVEPTPAPRAWDYGRPGQQYVCWTVLQHAPSNNAIAYCEDGFGPTAPWGLQFLSGEHLSMGMDSQWYPTFLQTFFESIPATFLPLWRVFRTDASGIRVAISGEGTWDETWSAVMAHREADTSVRYDCDASIAFERE